MLFGSTFGRPEKTVRHVATFGIIAILVWNLFSSFFSHSDPLVNIRTSRFDPFDYINPFIGTINGGHVFAGASLPFGLAKAVADVRNREENQAGFASDDSPIYGFSHMHDSGTGGAASMGNFPIYVYPGCPRGGDAEECLWGRDERASLRVNGSVRAHPGYFRILLENGVDAEMTVSNRTALYRFKITDKNPELTGGRVVLMDPADLQGSVVNSWLKWDKERMRLYGNGTFMPSFGSGTYKTYVCADIRGLPSAGKMDEIQLNPPVRIGAKRNLPTPGSVVLRLPEDTNEILVRVGLSFISDSQACANGKREIPDFDFERTQKIAEAAWRKKLSVVSVKPGRGTSKELQTVFWSGLYRTMLAPMDYTGENPLWKSDEPYYDSFYCIWDSFRSIHPLYNIIDPESQALMVRSLLDTYKHLGWLPDCRMSLCKGYTQGGSNADVLIADAYLKNISQNVNWTLAYEAVLADAEKQPDDWGIEGRGSLEAWKSLGYIPKDDTKTRGFGLRTRSISRTVEYAYDDFSIAVLADRLGHKSDAKKYLKRSANWQNLFRKDQRSAINGNDTGFRGFLQPRLTNGSWDFQDPLRCSFLMDFHSCYYDGNGGETYEGTIWMYTFYAPQDHETLIKSLGGRKRFIERLDFLHDTPGLLYLGDEQAFLPVFQYHYAGFPHKSTDRAHFYIPSQFNASINGIPGNDDSGAMGSFAVFSMMGMWPIPGQDVYLIMAPFFEEVAVTSPITGKTAKIVNRHFDPTYKRRYIQRAKLNGKEWTKNWLTHKFWVEGGTLELELGERPSAWGTREEDVPPSYRPGVPL